MYMLHSPSILSFLLLSRHSLYYVNIRYVECDKMVCLRKPLSEGLKDVCVCVCVSVNFHFVLGHQMSGRLLPLYATRHDTSVSRIGEVCRFNRSCRYDEERIYTPDRNSVPAVQPVLWLPINNMKPRVTVWGPNSSTHIHSDVELRL